MLHELIVENYAVVDRLRVRFHPGLNLLTGETGSGKSIVVDALGLLLGGRASADMIRSGRDRARVSGVFETPERAAKVLLQAGFESDEAELLLDREILSNGKSRVYVNNRPATVALLRELASYLGDIHGQHDQQLPFDPAAQLSMLDSFAGARDCRVRVRELYQAWRRTSGQIAELEGADQEKLRLLDLWQFQRHEIEAAELQSGEDTNLDAERRVQQNAGRLMETAGAAYESLYEAPDSVTATVRSVAKKLDELARIDDSMLPVRQALEPALLAVEDVSYSLRDYLAKVELKRDLAAAAREYEQASGQLTALRRKAAQELARRVEAELKPLAMERTVFRIEIESAAWSETGADRVSFLVSPNAGEAPKAMEKIASGGELSRIALALKTCLVGSRGGGSGAASVRTLVFDEIDTGIGGRAAEGVARRLKTLAAENQVLCVTHLAQIACFADHHYRVGKFEREGRTVAEIEELDSAGSTEEIGRMLSGQNLTPEAMRNAAELIRAARA